MHSDAAAEGLPIILGNIDAPAKPKDTETAPQPESLSRSDADPGEPHPAGVAPDATPSVEMER